MKDKDGFVRIILSYRNSPLAHRLDKCGGLKLKVRMEDLCNFLLEVKLQGFNEVLQYDWMNNREMW